MAVNKSIVDWKTITNFVVDAFVGYGIPRADAEICADVLLESDKRGIESHGVNRFKPIYLDRIKAGIQNPVTNFEIVKETPTTAVVDGHDGMGQVIGYKSMQMAIDKAKEYGMGMVVVRNSCHYGIAGYYTSMAAKQGCIGMTGTNARPSVAPTWGVEGMFGTNPFTLGVPSDEPFDFNFDAATSITQNGKIEYYERIGEDVHPGTIVGDDGEPVSGDAGVALKRIRQGTAALTTLGGIGEALGGYKGYGFALFVELLSCVLQDGQYGKALNGVDENGQKCKYPPRPLLHRHRHEPLPRRGDLPQEDRRHHALHARVQEGARRRAHLHRGREGVRNPPCAQGRRADQRERPEGNHRRAR